MKYSGKSVLDHIQGTKTVDPKELSAFRKAMTEQVIPEIIRIIGDRNNNAAQLRNKPLNR